MYSNVKSNVGVIEKIRKHDFKLALTLRNPDQFLSTYLRESGFHGIRKIGAHKSRDFEFNSHIRPFFFPDICEASRHAFILFYGSAFSYAPSYCVRWLSICVSNKMSEPETIFSPLFLCFKPKGARVYTLERGFSAEGWKGARKTANQICRLGKCCTGLGPYHAPSGESDSHRKCISRYRSDSSNILLAKESTWRTVTFNFLCDARNEK